MMAAGFSWPDSSYKKTINTHSKMHIIMSVKILTLDNDLYSIDNQTHCFDTSLIADPR